MKYVGSKSRHAKHILPIILSGRTDEMYVEPFVGGFNVIDKVGGPRIASDSHPYLIALFKAVRDGWLPPEDVSETTYKSIKAAPENYAPELVGFVGFGCSYSGKWFGGYARGNDSKGKPRNYALESRKNLLNQVNGLQGIDIRQSNYLDLVIPNGSIVYCDPPYANSQGYGSNFDHEQFWEWVRQISKLNRVYVSEYTAPDDFVPVWTKQVYNTLDKNTGSKSGIEKLFIPKVSHDIPVPATHLAQG